MIKVVNKGKEVKDYARNLCKDDLHAGYHRIKIVEKVKEYIERAIGYGHERIIVCYRMYKLCGVCIYFWKLDKEYAQTTCS